MLVHGLTATSAGALPTWMVAVTLIGAVNGAGGGTAAAPAAGASRIVDAASTTAACRAILMVQAPCRRFRTPGSSRGPRTLSKSHRAVLSHPNGKLVTCDLLQFSAYGHGPNCATSPVGVRIASG